jgi:transposase
LQAELARAEVADLCRFSENIDALTARIVRRVKDLGSTLPTLPGCAELTAAKLIWKPPMWTASPMRAGSPDTLA